MKAQAIIDALMEEPRLAEGKRSRDVLIAAGFPEDEHDALWAAVLGRTEYWERRRIDNAQNPALAIGAAFFDGLLIGLQVARDTPGA